MPWADFETVLRRVLRLGSDVTVKDIEYLVKDSQSAGHVNKDKWEYLLKWFSPLQVTESATGWTFAEILDVVVQR
jgi:hypothetical protein